MNVASARPRDAAPAAPAPPAGRVASTLLAFTAGFVDTAIFIALFGLFAAHVTGNFVLIGASLAGDRPGLLGKLLAFPVFLLAVAATRAFELRCLRRGRDVQRPVLVVEMVFLALCLVAGVRATPIVDPDALATLVPGLLGVVAMAVQNAASRTAFAGHGPTTVMTGNVTQIVIDLTDLAVGGAPAAARARLRAMAPPVLGFLAGAIAGAFGIVHLGFACLLLPLAALARVAWMLRRARSSADGENRANS
jgi:uncharacterized membrane protein YoaK (UPF0700 family)